VTIFSRKFKFPKCHLTLRIGYLNIGLSFKIRIFLLRFCFFSNVTIKLTFW